MRLPNVCLSKCGADAPVRARPPGRAAGSRETVVRRIITVLCALLVWASATAQTAPRTVPWRAKIAEAGYLRGVVVLPASRLSAGLVEDIGRTALEEGRACDLVHVEIYSEEDYPPSHYLMLSHAGYDWWWMNFQRATPYPVGRIVALGRNAVAEFRDGHGTVTRNVLAGSDPLDVETPNGQFSLLHFTFRSIPLAREKGWPVPESLDVFAKTDRPLDPASGKALVGVLHGLLPFREITLLVRNDTWFLDVSGYPLEYPFQAKHAPPTKDEFVESPTLLCGGLTTESYNCHTVRGQ